MLTHSRLLELLNYEPDTGIFTRRACAGRWGREPSGKVVGSNRSDGYVKVLIDGRSYLAHRLAWLYVYGDWPEKQIDHVNGQRADNRVENLRDVSPSVNKENLRRAQRDNRLGVQGVVQYGERYQATLKVRGESVYLGRFDSSNAAHAAYIAAKRRHHAGCTL